MARWTRSKRAWSTAGLVLLTAFTPLVWRVGDASAEAAPVSILTATARADVTRMTWKVPGAPVTDNVTDSGGPTARAMLSTVSGIRAFAASPEPGENARGGPGVVLGALGANGVPVKIDLPSYPFMAAAEYPGVPSQKVGAGSYLVEATAQEQASAAVARSGIIRVPSLSVVSSEATSSATKESERIVAKASALAEGITIGPLTLGQVRSTAEVTSDAKGKLDRASTLQILGASVGGSSFGLTPAGTDFGGSPAPISAVEQISALNQVLAPTKIELSFFPQQETGSGVVSPALEIRLPFPTQSGEGVLTFIIGATSASVDTATFDENLPTEDPASGGTAETSGTQTSANQMSVSDAPAGGAWGPLNSSHRNQASARAFPGAIVPQPGEPILPVAASTPLADDGAAAARVAAPATALVAPARTSRPTQNFQIGSLFALLLALVAVGLVGTTVSVRRR